MRRVRWFGGPDGLLLPLRGFLAVVFVYAGFSKIADDRFLDPDNPVSMHSAVLAARGIGPASGLLGPVAAHSFAFGIALAVAELAVGLGLAAGLFTRVAAAGGMLISLALWLTTSWQATPWFTSADVVYLVALTPLLLAGPGGLSLDGWIHRNRIPARSGAGTAAGASQASGSPEEGAPVRGRRSLLTLALTAVGAVTLGTAALVRRPRTAAADGTRNTATQPQRLASVSAVPLGGAKEVTIDATGTPAWLVQLQPGDFTAVDARCPHQGCAVRFLSAEQGFGCPCHTSRFDARGRLLSGPARTGLTRLQVAVRDGYIDLV